MKTELSIETKISSEILNIIVSGEIDSSNYEIFKNEVFEAYSASANIKQISFDIGGCDMISSNGFGIFYELIDTIEKRNSKIAVSIRNANSAIKKIIKLLKMTDEFDVQ